MKITALENFAPRWWAPEDQDPDHLVEFEIRPLDGEQYAELAQYVITVDDQTRFGADAVKVALRHGLVGWRGLKTQSGADVECRPGNHKLLPFEIRSLIFARILEISNLDEDQEKNFESPLTLQKTGSDSIA